MSTKAAKTWSPTKHQGLYRHSSDTYYARIVASGKKTWRSLKTKVLGVALEELAKLREETSHLTKLSQEITVHENLTGGQAIQLRMTQIENDPRMKGRTKKYWEEVKTAVLKSWPELDATELRKIPVEACEAWAGKYSKQVSPTRYNNALSFLKSIFRLAVRKGARRTNPAEDLKRVKVRNKDLSTLLPDLETFAKWIAAMRAAGGGYSGHAADFVEFVSYCGARLGETHFITVAHCNEQRGEITIVGDPGERTKNSEVRIVPMIPAMRELLQRIKAKRPDLQPEDLILRVHEAQKTMDNAAKKIGMHRITHHDLRHFFATICIESGVSVPVVAKWLGHKDGGALLMKTYTHVRNQHSLEAATRVSFAASPPPATPSPPPTPASRAA